ncbi:MAG: IgGFc-binding protein [Persicimonas sp.]
MMRRLIAVFAAGLLVLAACNDDNGEGDAGQHPDAGDAGDAAADVDDADAISCEPGEIIECTEENTQGLERCNDEGDGYVQSSCGDNEVCREAECVEVDCVPGTRRCESDSLSQRCNEEGTEWEDLEECEDGNCDDGYCLDRCESAEIQDDYIACEYWAVELENHLLGSSEDDEGDDTGEPVPDDERAPFAIVLANTADYDAEVSVYSAEGQYAEAEESRLVTSDISFPGTDYQTVHSELVDVSGDRIGDPIDGPVENLSLPSNSLMTLVLPRRDIPYGESSLGEFAYRVESNEPIVAYQFNPLCCNYNYTNDASLLLPTSALSEHYMYMGYAVWRSGTGDPFAANMTILGTEEDTDVTVTLREPKGSEDDEGAEKYDDYFFDFADDSRIEGPDENGILTFDLQPHEAFNLAVNGLDPTQDLTGALVEASEPVAVFGNHSCTNVPFNSPACDHLESQLFPLETWGEVYVASPLKLRQDDPSGTREGTYWKFLARENGTRIDVGVDLEEDVMAPADEGVPHCKDFALDNLDGSFELDRGETCEFGTREMFVAEGSDPFLLGAFLSGQNSVTEDAEWDTHAGDPAYYLVPPEEQYRPEYSFLVPSTYHQSYVTVTAPPGVSIELDGESVDLTDHDYVHDEDNGWVTAHVPVDAGPHYIASENQIRFGIVVYGYDDYVSYAYTGGLNLKKRTEWD